jgi:hypothetical protein
MVLVESIKVSKKTRVVDLRRTHGRNQWTQAKSVMGEREG